VSIAQRSTKIDNSLFRDSHATGRTDDVAEVDLVEQGEHRRVHRLGVAEQLHVAGAVADDEELQLAHVAALDDAPGHRADLLVGLTGRKIPEGGPDRVDGIGLVDPERGREAESEGSDARLLQATQALAPRGQDIGLAAAPFLRSFGRVDGLGDVDLAGSAVLSHRRPPRSSRRRAVNPRA
jgi:hypothetical protein